VRRLHIFRIRVQIRSGIIVLDTSIVINSALVVLLTVCDGVHVGHSTCAREGGSGAMLLSKAHYNTSKSFMMQEQRNIRHTDTCFMQRLRIGSNMRE